MRVPKKLMSVVFSVVKESNCKCVTASHDYYYVVKLSRSNFSNSSIFIVGKRGVKDYTLFSTKDSVPIADVTLDYIKKLMSVSCVRKTYSIEFIKDYCVSSFSILDW